MQSIVCRPTPEPRHRAPPPKDMQHEEPSHHTSATARHPCVPAYTNSTQCSADNSKGNSSGSPQLLCCALINLSPPRQVQFGHSPSLAPRSAHPQMTRIPSPALQPPHPHSAPSTSSPLPGTGCPSAARCCWVYWLSPSRSAAPARAACSGAGRSC